MKIFIISDIHGSAAGFEKAVILFKKEKADLMVICGDYLNHGPRNDIPAGYDTKRTAAALNEMKASIVGVRGNCDSEVDQMMLEFPVTAPVSQIILPSSTSEKICLNGRIFIHHGHLYTQEQAASINPKGTVVISGHTHIPLLQINYGCVFVNPGSVSIPKGDSVASCSIIQADMHGINSISLYTLDGVCFKDIKKQDGFFSL